MQILNHYHENPDSFSSSLSLNTSLSCIPKGHSLYNYIKETDQPGLPDKEGYYATKTKDGKELYAGKFVLDNQHGNSIYKWITDDGITVYEGYIYCNFVQGYGRFSYPDGSVHEGLFKNNRRYGPGIHTEPNGKQNVGMWNNKKLLKLSTNVNARVPTLCQTREGRAKAIRFRNLMEVKRYNDKAKDILYDMDAPSHIMDISDCLYNVLTKDPRSITFNWKPYEEMYDEKITQVKLEEIVENLFKPEKKIRVGKPKRKGKFKWKDIIDEMDRKKVASELLVVNATHLICWNNSSLMKDMMLFCFKHIFQEDAINYEVANITKGKRECFRAPGTHETLCVRFLKKCEIGDYSRANDYLAFKHIDPNLADSQGNTGLIIAAANDQLAVIDVLLDRGADINLCNDDGFTPLALCITRYLGLVNNFKDWEKEFLSNLEEINYPENTLKWRHPGKELQCYYRYLDDIADDEIQTLEDPGTKEKNEKSHPDSEDFKAKIAAVKETILKLIQRGADLASNIPKPILVMAIKSRDEELIKSLLEAKHKEGLVKKDDPFFKDALYTAVQLPADEIMVSICAALLKYGADPNVPVECLQEYDRTFLELCDLSDDEIGEKTILHYLATGSPGSQFDEHLCAVVKLLLSNGANPDAIYLGHTPLSAAIAKGNVGMIKCLMTHQVNPNQKLAKELGVPLTLLMKAECFQNLSTTDAISIVDILVNNGIDLLADVEVGSFTGNIKEFGNKEIEKFRQDSKKNKVGRRGRTQEYQVLLDHITKLAQQALMKRVIHFLFKSPQSPTPQTSKLSQSTSIQSNKTSRTSSVKRSEENMQSIFSEFPSWLNDVDVIDIIDIINNIQEQEKSLLSEEQASEVLQMVMSSESNLDDPQQLGRYLSMIKGSSGYDAKRSKLLKTTLKRSGDQTSHRGTRKLNLLAALKKPRSLEESGPESIQSTRKHEFNKYGRKSDVCFGCGRTFDQDLLRLCPECKLVKFCSPECFKKSRRNKTHQCTGDIFSDWKDLVESHIDDDQQGKQPGPSDTSIKRGKIDRKEDSSKTAGEKRKSRGKKGMKKLSVKEEAGIQNLSEKELAEKRKSDSKKEADNIEHKTQTDKSNRFGKYPRGQGDYLEDKYQKGKDTQAIDNIRDSVSRPQHGRGDIRKEEEPTQKKRDTPRKDTSHFDLKFELMLNEGLDDPIYHDDSKHTRVKTHMFKDGSIYYTNDPKSKKLPNFNERENYAFN